MLTAFLLLISSTFATYPLGEETLQWGISEQALTDQRDVIKVNPSNPQGQHYTDFSEINPVVYIERSEPGKKIEYYFFEGKLYKTFIIHLEQDNAHARYQEKLEALTKSLGTPSRQHQSMVYSIPVYHSIWQFGDEEFDLRFGAGYIYEVRTHKPTAKKKKIKQEGWELI